MKLFDGQSIKSIKDSVGLPLITVITAHYDDIRQLEITFNSLNSQENCSWKWLIIDSFTPGFMEKIAPEIASNPFIKIHQCETSIYDAMNLGILLVDTEYFHFLNSGSTYSSNFSLAKALYEMNSRIKVSNKSHVFAFDMQLIESNKSSMTQSVNPYLFPYFSGHEATIYPNRRKKKILHSSAYGVSADLDFMFNYSIAYDVSFINSTFVNYPRGGFSDSPSLKTEKFNGYLKLAIKFLLHLKFSCTAYSFYRALATIVRE